MSKDITKDLYAVLLPAFSGLDLEDSTKEMLERGCKSILLGESREEYVARNMSTERIASEKTEDFHRITSEARNLAGKCLVAVDQELGGIQRLHHLVPPLPSVEEVLSMGDHVVRESCMETARAARNLGVNLFLAPIVDMLTGSNPWLEGRTMEKAGERLEAILISYIEGVQSAGVAVSPKHFPGYPHVTGDPALEPAVSRASREELAPMLNIFQSIVRTGVESIMLGPAIVRGIDPVYPASISTSTVELLKWDMGFRGLVVSDDLDAKGVLMDKSLEETAIASLNAGADLLLLAAGPHLHNLVDALVKSVESGELPESRLHHAAEKVRMMAEKVSE